MRWLDNTALMEMFHMKKLSICFIVLAILLSNIMCAVVAWNYCDILWGIKYAGYSAPASTAFLSAVPFVVGIGSCIALALYFRRKSAKMEKSEPQS
jgi:hypothetical protein